MKKTLTHDGDPASNPTDEAQREREFTHDQTGELDYGIEGGQSQGHGADRTEGTGSPVTPSAPRPTTAAPSDPAKKLGVDAPATR